MQDINQEVQMMSPAAVLATPTDLSQIVLKVLREIRPLQADGLPYDKDTNLSDAGFTSVEMVKVMLGVEAAFDLMIPQDAITPENFTSGATISTMIAKLYP
jgi:acyl carrier protein